MGAPCYHNPAPTAPISCRGTDSHEERNAHFADDWSCGRLVGDVEPGTRPDQQPARRRHRRRVTVNGKPAARSGDTTSNGGPLVEGVPNVLINGKPAVVMGDRTHCGGKTTSGSHGVFINGKPMVREGDQTSGCPQ